jgi:hypothetical protein
MPDLALGKPVLASGGNEVRDLPSEHSDPLAGPSESGKALGEAVDVDTEG